MVHTKINVKQTKSGGCKGGNAANGQVDASRHKAVRLKRNTHLLIVVFLLLC